MNNLNSLIIEGNVVKQGALSEPTNGFKKCSFPVAVNRWYKNKNGEGVTEVSFFDVEAYGKMAEICEQQTLKGRGVRVVGRLKQERWKDNEDKSHSRIYVVAEHIEYKPKPQIEDEVEVEVSEAETTEVEQDSVVEEAVF